MNEATLNIPLLRPLLAEFERLCFEENIKRVTYLNELISESVECMTGYSDYFVCHAQPLLTTISSLCQEHSQLEFIDFEGLLSWHVSYLEDQKRHQEDGHNFNIFEILNRKFGFRVMEKMHSRLIKYLLDRDANHGQGERFLFLMLNKLGVEAPEQGRWVVTAEQGGVDILLKREEPHSVIIIENKSNWAVDQPNQLYRYWYNHIFLYTQRGDERFYGENREYYRVIYLPPNQSKQYEQQSITKPVDYDAELPNMLPIRVEQLPFDVFVKKWLDQCVASLPKTNHRVREYIEQYKELCETL